MQPPFSAYDYIIEKQSFIFVSYAHSDAELVYPIIKKIHEQGIPIWYDEGIEASTEWMAKIADSLNQCHGFIIFLTNASILRNNVKREISFALKRYDNKEIQFIPVYLEKIALPAELELAIGPIQAILKYNLAEEQFYSKLNLVLKEWKKDTVKSPKIEYETMLEKVEYEVVKEIEMQVGPIPLIEKYELGKFGVIIDKSHVTGLGLTSKGLKTIPNSIGNLRSLEVLDISSNQITSLPESIGNLKSLKALSLENNQLNSIPDSIRNLSGTLKQLALKGNLFTSFPDSIVDLNSLFYLSYNKEQIPKDIQNRLKQQHCAIF